MTDLAARESGESDILHLNIRRCVLPLKRRGGGKASQGANNQQSSDANILWLVVKRQRKRQI